ncbi:MAG: hypothetical protein K9K88_04250 [Desulfobacterales bacterium]|nr:hypothetical protein [Desulfobacterales bacterium]
MDRDQYFADETRTGKIVHDLRGIGAIIVIARFPGKCDLDWLNQLYRDLKIQGEIKSEVVIEVCRVNTQRRAWLLEKLSVATIAIVDVAEHIREIFDELGKLFGNKIPTQVTAATFLKSGRIPQEYITSMLSFLREMAINDSAAEAIANILRMAVTETEITTSLDNVLFDRRILLEMNEREFAEFSARFAIAFADALDPLLQVKVIEKELKGMRFFNEGTIALRIIESAIEPDFVFDLGSKKPFQNLQEAHQYMCIVVNQAFLSNKGIGPGSVFQNDSRKVLSLQAADIAAGVAREILESNYPDVQRASMAVKSIFERVLFNTRWLK